MSMDSMTQQREECPAKHKAKPQGVEGRNVMYHVYFLRSISSPRRTYIGFTQLPPAERLTVHNRAAVPSTSRHAPWELIAYVAVTDKQTALNLETYFKSGSGHAFWHKRFVSKQS